MVRSLQLELRAEEAYDALKLRAYLQDFLGVSEKELSGWKITRRSIDARSRVIKVNLKLDIYLNEP
ncbi:MAG TPA: FAD-binding protein, partial [Bacteroidia bacterium]|nr:FAD-binding protein [Bacteroidia bacterium]